MRLKAMKPCDRKALIILQIIEAQRQKGQQPDQKLSVLGKDNKSCVKVEYAD